MRVLHVNDYADGGGAEVVMRRTAALLQARGCGMDIFTSADIPGHRRTPLSYIDSGSARRALRHRVEQFRPDVLHLHNIYHELSPGILTELAREKRCRRLRVVMTAHDHHLLCPNAGMTFMAGGERMPVDARRRLGWRDLLARRWDHRGWGHSWLRAAQHVWNYRWLRRERVLDAVICPSRWLQGALAARGLPAIFLPHPAPVIEPSQRTRPDHLAFVFAGRIEPEKGLRRFITSLPADFNGRVVVVGEGSERRACESAARSRGLVDRIEFTGRRTHAETLALISEAHVLIMPSLCHESYGLGLVEALSVGTNVLAADVPALREIIDDSGAGFAYDASDRAALAGALNQIAAAFRRSTLNAFDASGFLAARTDAAHVVQLLAIYGAA